MEIRISDIPDGGLTIEGDIAPEEMNIHESSFSIDHPLRVHLFVEIVDNVLVVRGAYLRQVYQDFQKGTGQVGLSLQQGTGCEER